MNNRIICRVCGWRGTIDQALEGKSPFDDTEIGGCPKCKEINPFHIACDEPGCWNDATMGAPTESGYRHTCWKHYPLHKTKKGKFHD